MSYTELKVFDAVGDALGVEEFRNSRYILVVWEMLAIKYGICPAEDSYSIVYDDEKADALWALENSKEITDDDWYVLVATFDNMVIPSELVEPVAHAFENFYVPEGYIDHGKGFAKAMRGALKDTQGCRGVAFWTTSVISDPWTVNNYETDESRPYNLDVDMKHSVMKKRGLVTEV